MRAAREVRGVHVLLFTPLCRALRDEEEAPGAVAALLSSSAACFRARRAMPQSAARLRRAAPPFQSSPTFRRRPLFAFASTALPAPAVHANRRPRPVRRRAAVFVRQPLLLQRCPRWSRDTDRYERWRHLLYAEAFSSPNSDAQHEGGAAPKSEFTRQRRSVFRRHAAEVMFRAAALPRMPLFADARPRHGAKMP